MGGYKESVRLWKRESFRTYISEEKRKHDLKIIEENIKKLIEKRETLQPETYTYSQGNTVKKLKTLLPWENMKPYVKEFNRKQPNTKTTTSLLRFFSELLSH